MLLQARLFVQWAPAVPAAKHLFGMREPRSPNASVADGVVRACGSEACVGSVVVLRSLHISYTSLKDACRWGPQSGSLAKKLIPVGQGMGRGWSRLLQVPRSWEGPATDFKGAPCEMHLRSRKLFLQNKPRLT